MDGFCNLTLAIVPWVRGWGPPRLGICEENIRRDNFPPLYVSRLTVSGFPVGRADILMPVQVSPYLRCYSSGSLSYM